MRLGEFRSLRFCKLRNYKLKTKLHKFQLPFCFLIVILYLMFFTVRLFLVSHVDVHFVSYAKVESTLKPHAVPSGVPTSGPNACVCRSLLLNK